MTRGNRKVMKTRLTSRTRWKNRLTLQVGLISNFGLLQLIFDLDEFSAKSGFSVSSLALYPTNDDDQYVQIKDAVSYSISPNG